VKEVFLETVYDWVPMEKRVKGLKESMEIGKEKKMDLQNELCRRKHGVGVVI